MGSKVNGKYILEMYGDINFLGYASHIREKKREVESTYCKEEALCFSTEEAAMNAIDKVAMITNGGITCIYVKK